MQAMLLEQPGQPLKPAKLETPEPERNQILIQVNTCGICRTDLHIADGELTPPHFPLILGHQIVGIVSKLGKEAHRFKVGQRVGVPWLGRSCQQCFYCHSKQENLCETASYTGYHINGGFAEFCAANEAYCFPLPEAYSDLQVAPLLCGGLIGYRAFRMVENAKRLGFYGFGSSAHILLQIAVHQGKEVFAFTRSNDTEAQNLALKLGANWAGSSEEMPPEYLDGAIIFAPNGELVPIALKAVRKGGSVICAGIYMSDIPTFPYERLYGERILRSVTNLTREDGEIFFNIASHLSITTKVTPYPLREANQALNDLREGKVTGSLVLTIRDSLAS
jgi:alcohol dehydrogenase, propanol-preferring